MAISYLDGIRLSRSLEAGFWRVHSRQDYLNRINVFPVADNDTGTNLAATLETIGAGIQRRVEGRIDRMSWAIADSALDGARGNSGAILAQFLVGFAEAIQGQKKLELAQFARAVTQAKDYAYQALVKPREGTILTVMSAWAGHIHSLAQRGGDFVDLLRQALSRAQQALENTPRQLEVLARAGVVDAGAQGFVDLLQGIQDFIHSGTISKDKIPGPRDRGPRLESIPGEKYRYCTECMLLAEALDRRALQEELIPQGGSIILAGGPKKARVHIHTDEPATVFAICRRFGQVQGEKADDLHQQQRDARQDHPRIAVVVDSGCDLPEEILEEWNIHMIPVRLNFGHRHYLDKVTMNQDQFWQALATSSASGRDHPQTSQPTPGDFRRQYQFLAGHYEGAVSIHLPGTLSGTLQSAHLATRAVAEFPLQVIDSLNGSIGQGLIALRAAEAVRAGKSLAQVEAITLQAVKNTRLYIALKTLANAVRGGRVSPSVQGIAEGLRINPVLSFTKKGISTIGITLGRRNWGEKFRRFVWRRLPQGSYRVGIAHANNAAAARRIETALVDRLGRERVIFTEVGPALGVHAGPGALAVAISSLEDDLGDG